MNRIWVLPVLLPETEVQDLISLVNSIAVKTSDKNTRTRALWVISKQTFPSEIVEKEVSFFTALFMVGLLLVLVAWFPGEMSLVQFLGHSPLSSFWIWRLFSIKFDNKVQGLSSWKIIRAATEGKEPTNYCFSWGRSCHGNYSVTYQESSTEEKCCEYSSLVRGLTLKLDPV